MRVRRAHTKELRRATAMIGEDILQKFPDLFGTKKVNGRDVDVEQTIAALTRELGPEIAAALTARRTLLQSPAPVRTKYAWLKWNDTFEDPVTGKPWTFRQIVQGLIDNVLGRDSEWRWRLNDEVPIPKDAHPLTNPGLELTGPWHPLDMAFNALNSPAPMNMPDFEDASPPHFQPDGTPTNQPVGIFAAMQNAKEIFEGRWADRPYEVVKKGQKRAYKIKVLYEEGNAGRFLPAISWVLRRRLLGTNVGRWDYLASLIEMWKDDPQGVFPDPQTIGMASPNMIAYQQYNALMMLMAGMKKGELSQGAPIGGMAAVMIYQPSDPYGRSKYNPLALRAMVIDKLRERLLGLMFVPERTLPADQQTTLEDILAGRVKGRLYDAYRQSWVASPEPAYVAAGNAPLRAPLTQLQAILDAPRDTVEVKGKPVATVGSGLMDAERGLLQSRGLLNPQGKIMPRVITKDMFDTPEKLFTQELWDAIYGVPKGEITVEHIQHAFYMAANYGFQILNGNFAAAIDAA